jgi:hypothetical protein
MREFAAPQSRAAALPLPARILYTVFAVLTLAGCVSCAGLYDDIVHFDARATPHQLYERLVAHYVPGPGEVGDAIDRRKLVETTHAHLFTMPVLLLIAGHLFLLARASNGLKAAAVSIASAATVLHLAAPWIILATSGQAIATVLYPLTGGLLLVSFVVLLVVPVAQMWWPRGAAT